MSPRVISDLLSKLRKGCAAGMDGITTEHLFYGRSDVLCKHLSTFYTIILSYCVVPYMFTVGTIVPILKQATLNPNVPANYRPITLTSTFAKLAELLMNPSDSGLGLSNGQYGFREGRGTDFCTAMMNDVCMYAKRYDTPLHFCSLDAEKCFDKIWHPGLFSKLLSKLPTEHWTFLYKWYSQLKASVKWNGFSGPVFRITRGTRQGSALSPVLFNIFINDLLLELDACEEGGIRIGRYFFNFFAYADDITLFSTTVSGLQRLIDICQVYAKTWRFNFGIKKTKCVTFGKNLYNYKPQWSLLGNIIETVDYLDVLGVKIDKCLNGNKHAEYRVKACRNVFYSLARCGLGHPSALSSEAKIELLRCVCMPTLFYACGSVHLSNGCLKRMQSLQGTLLKRSFGLRQSLHHTPLMNALGIDPARNCIESLTVNLVRRLAKVNCPARDLVFLKPLVNVPGTTIHRLSQYGKGLVDTVLSKSKARCNAKQMIGTSGLLDSIRTAIFTNKFNFNNSMERHFINNLLASF